MRRLLALGSLSVALLAACAVTPDGSDTAATDESNLDYRSTAGREYDIQGDAVIQLTGDDAALTGDARASKATDLARAKVDAITRTLNAKLTELWPEDKRTNEKNIVVWLRMATPASDTLTADGDGYRFTYRAQAAGPNDMLDTLPLAKDGDKRTLALDVDGAPITLAWSRATETANAYPQYAEMFQDGLDIAIQVGGDHYTPRNDLNESEAIYDDLVSMGLASPVATFADLKLDSGAFKGSLRVGSEDVPVRATLVHADMAPADHLDVLVDAWKKAASTADIVIYRGHAGPDPTYNGVVVHYNPRVALPMSEFKSIDLPDKYQLFVFDGCETYTGYADAIYAHAKKTEKNADVITSVNFASSLVRAESVRTLLHGMLDKTPRGWAPRSYDTLLKKLNDAQRGSWTSIYGVHGLSDNQKISMLADPAKIGAACTAHADCGGADSLCVTLSDRNVCGAACADDTGCPEGTKCRPVHSQSLGDMSQCLPPR
jgi:hypothetical protein